MILFEIELNKIKARTILVWAIYKSNFLNNTFHGVSNNFGFKNSRQFDVAIKNDVKFEFAIKCLALHKLLLNANELQSRTFYSAQCTYFDTLIKCYCPHFISSSLPTGSTLAKFPSLLCLSF
jgi:hypothetical protein